jgi:hypothetical protein
MAAQSRSRFSQPAMMRLPRIFVPDDIFYYSHIHCTQNPAYSLNVALRPPVIRNDFAVGEYSPKYFVKVESS